MNPRHCISLMICVSAAIALSAPSARAEAVPSPNPAEELHLQYTLLNKVLRLPKLQQYSPATKTWRPLERSAARVRVLSLWSLTCRPCIEELPMLTAIAEQWRTSPRDVQFLFLADPPDESTRSAVEEFWSSPSVPWLADRCKDHRSGKLGQIIPKDGQPACLLDLHHAQVARSSSEAEKVALSVAARPLTLLLDEKGTIRQVFLGSLSERRDLLVGAIKNLLRSS